MTTVRELLDRESFFDAAILRHGFTDYMRDYEVVVGGFGPENASKVFRYQFIGCVEAQCVTRLGPATFAQSISDEFVLSGPDYPEKADPLGFIWGVRYSTAYPGLKYVESGAQARRWTKRIGRQMHEVTIET